MEEIKQRTDYSNIAPKSTLSDRGVQCFVVDVCALWHLGLPTHAILHTSSLFEKLNILDLSNLNKYLVSQLMFKSYTKKLQYIFDEYFICNSDVHQHDTRNRNHLHYASFKTALGKRSLIFWGVLIWNYFLSLNFDFNVKPMTFKNNLKNALLNGKLVFPVYD